MKILERLGCLRAYFTSKQNIYTNSIIRFLITRLRSLVKGMPLEAIGDGIKIIRPVNEDDFEDEASFKEEQQKAEKDAK